MYKRFPIQTTIHIEKHSCEGLYDITREVKQIVDASEAYSPSVWIHDRQDGNGDSHLKA
ncbi:MAG: hypothetical protein RBT74_07875 [Tenuifilaceae bacterium]|nr:hypothetical protein [Tenuifilaceae bacterium]